MVSRKCLLSFHKCFACIIEVRWGNGCSWYCEWPMILLVYERMNSSTPPTPLLSVEQFSSIAWRLWLAISGTEASAAARTSSSPSTANTATPVCPHSLLSYSSFCFSTPTFQLHPPFALPTSYISLSAIATLTTIYEISFEFNVNPINKWKLKCPKFLITQPYKAKNLK